MPILTLNTFLHSMYGATKPPDSCVLGTMGHGCARGAGTELIGCLLSCTTDRPSTKDLGQTFQLRAWDPRTYPTVFGHVRTLPNNHMSVLVPGSLGIIRIQCNSNGSYLRGVGIPLYLEA